jgi:fimbrial chaperone protein
MTVQPVVVDLRTAGRDMSQIITVENTFARQLPVELTVQELELTSDGVKGTGKDPGDLLIFPPQALIEPGQTQTFRVQYIGDPELARSKHYYVTVAQLPVKLPEGQSAIQILYNFQVLVSVAPTGMKPALKVQSAELGHDKDGKPVPVLTLVNGSTAHGYLSGGHLRVVAKDASGAQVFSKTLSGPDIQQTMGFGLVGGGQTRKVSVPVPLPEAAASVDATFTPDD